MILIRSLRKKYFNNVVVAYDTAVNKKSKSYWDSIRPVPLEPEEVKDYKIKDSVFQTQRDSAWSQEHDRFHAKETGAYNSWKSILGWI